MNKVAEKIFISTYKASKRDLKYPRHTTYHNISITNILKFKEVVLLYQKWPWLINAKMFDKAYLKMSREVRGTPIIPWTMDNIAKFDRKAFPFSNT